MRVDIENGKYTYFSHDSGAELLRYGEPWQDVTGQKVWYCAAYELQEVREERDALAAHVERLRKPSIELAETVENRDDLPIHKWAIKCARLVSQVRKAAEQDPTTSLARHTDDAAVDRFAAAMKAKLAGARAKGRDGWDDPNRCSAEFLADMLVGHVAKGNAGNLEDIANLAMMLHQRGDDPAMLAASLARLKAKWKAEALDELMPAICDVADRAEIRSMRDELRRQAGGDA